MSYTYNYHDEGDHGGQYNLLWPLVLIGGYVFLCLPVLFYLFTSLAVIAVPLTVLAGVAFAVLRVVSTLAGRAPKARIVTPADEAARYAKRIERDPEFRVDVAWPSYFLGQVRHDQWAAARWVFQDLRWVGQRAAGYLSRDRLKSFLMLWPLFLLFAMIGLSVGLLLGLVLAVVINALVTVVLLGYGFAAVGVLRAAGSVRQRLRRSQPICAKCYHISPLPAYRCPGDHPDGKNLHRDLRPGRLGLLWRRCVCGTRLPTSRGRAGRTLVAVCQKCDQPLPRGAAAVTDVRIPVFGAPSAGKTQLISSGVVGLVDLSGKRNLVIKMASDDGDTHLRTYRQVVGTDVLPTKTGTEKPVGVAVSLRRRNRQVLMHVFDAAGEALSRASGNADYSYLDTARTLLFVLDPFSIPDVRDEMTSAYPHLAQQANVARDAPEDSYNGTVNRLRQYGVRTNRQRVAFVVTKVDLVTQMPIGGGLTVGRSASDAVRRWLTDRRLENLLLAAERDFGAVEYFAISAKESDRHNALAPFAWLLKQEKFALTG
ncbi:hypothetical protein OG792_05750 [Micromonospora sp. NBC_01699]|uniref:TRAFAC clade GTPase domain-containing protein n=1 Tax=Micromonospora sp. NBC_01699 TaxID=2975984 RepID=UPI002E316C25|nr:hypothetical protein [Micromonospora sp. NBC_01699]